MIPPNSPHALKGWKQAYRPIVSGDAPDGTLSLQALSQPSILAWLIPFVASNLASDRHQAALTIVHYTIGVVTETLIAPLLLDTVTIEAKIDQLGIVLEPGGALGAFWVGPGIQVKPGAAAAQLGAHLINLLEPFVTAAQIAGQIVNRGISLVMFDAIERGCRRLERTYQVSSDNGWIEELLTAMGYTNRKPHQTFTVQPDAGPPIEMTIPRVCCVLARQATLHSCPTCPQRPADARRQLTEDWLRALDDEDFRQTVGRSRITNQATPLYDGLSDVSVRGT